MKGLNDEDLIYLFSQASLAKSDGRSLSGVFSSFAREKKLAKGTVRNIYYKYLKRFEKDGALKEKYLGDKSLKAEKIVEFDKLEAKWLLKKILLGATFGKPVRKTIYELTGDAKKALRYQNKYRNMIRNDKDLVSSVREEIKAEIGRCYNPYETAVVKEDATLARLKKEINDLYLKIAKSARDENARLKEQLFRFEEENRRLKESLSNGAVKEYFKSPTAEFIGGKIHKDN